MKTAVSLPDDLFLMAEGVAHRLKVSRSQLYATALADFLERQRAGSVTEQLNQVYARRSAKVDPALHRAQLKSVDSDRW
jgi:metal-responsive CopG/Arc/MetJ family transcriptional regulator